MTHEGGEDWDAVQIRAAVRAAQDADEVRRLLAIAAMYDGKDRASASQIGAMDRSVRWTDRRCAIGCTVSTPKATPG